jgi:hypothetical protein
MYARTTQLEIVLRRALRRAGMVLGYRHKCRKHGCGYVEAATDHTIRRCPNDRWLLWVTSRSTDSDPPPGSRGIDERSSR